MGGPMPWHEKGWSSLIRSHFFSKHELISLLMSLNSFFHGWSLITWWDHGTHEGLINRGLVFNYLKILWIAIGNPWFLIELFHVEPHDVSLKIISVDDAHQWASSISFLMDGVIFSSFSISCKLMYSNCSHPLMPQWFHIGSIIDWFFPHSHRFHKLSLCW